jgi:hypothetical protein
MEAGVEAAEAGTVSAPLVREVADYIASQEEHHRRLTNQEELEQLVVRYGIEWGKETVKTVGTSGG